MRGSVKTEITPMFKQYLEIKNKYPEAILFFRLGDFYEMFFEDAETVAPLLGLVLTKREAGKNLTAPMCGIPVDRSSFYIKKLIEMGFKVAICEQVEDPALVKGLVKREVVKLYTPGLFIESEALGEGEKNYLSSLYKGKKIGLAFLELSCGEFLFTELEKELFLNEILKKEPKEVILSQELSDSEIAKQLKQSLPKIHLSWVEETFFKEELENLKSSYSELYPYGIKAVSAILKYISEYQPFLKERLSQPKFYFPQDFLFLEAGTKRNLELIRNLWDGTEKYSLYWVLNKTVTPMGARLLKEWILYPLRKINQIKLRQEAIKFLVEKKELREALKEILKKVSDLERLSVRCSLNLATPRELALLRDSLSYLPQIKNLLKEESFGFPEYLKNLLSQINTFETLYEELKKALVESPPPTLKEGGIFKKGFFSQLDELRDLKENALKYLLELEKREKTKTGIPTLKLGYNKVFGYYLEVSKSYLKQVPSYFERKQTLVNAERYVTQELKELETKILSAETKIRELEYELFLELRNRVSSYGETLKETAQSIAILDVLLALAQTASENNYVCPEIVDEPLIYIEKGRHPVLEKVQGQENFVPNSLKLDKEENVLLIITGPNMGGKSTYLRQNALIVILAHMGSFVPASFAKIGILDQIFTRIGASDELVRGRSTFMVEMGECAYILKHATSRSLVILDEIGRGTSTYDGLSLAWAIAEYLYSKKIFTLLATHYFELTELSKNYSGVKNFHVAVKEWKEEILFLYKVLPGAINESYGIEVAKLAGIPKEVLDRAKEILYKLEKRDLEKPTELCLSPKKRVFQLSIFENLHPILERLKSLKLEEMTPLSALNLLWEFQRELKKESYK
ncbi:MAG: DNA mismatch repair protein MutS [Thermodesulfobacteriaceae bacterium]|nr:DNA mismatch repair protein MutS [Thermodesulfobacteriaceae bacterium]MCX8041919.1 DNA mismatch repair protein MutS [Thermodesulfobacteriaceae bacterium]